ncbi:MAG: 3-phosphoshikimate 1-carboxyvinyltransferase [Propioniciclava sp.]
MTPWLAPTPDGPVTGVVVVPGSKSATARSYVLAALAEGPSVLTGALEARDTQLMRTALISLGVQFADTAADQVTIRPPEILQAGAVDCGLAGTIMRFLPPLAALASGSTRFDGDAEATARPVQPLLSGLAQVGVTIEHPESLPFTVHGQGGVAGGTATIDASASSQFVSGLLLSAARFDQGLELAHVGSRLPSPPHIELTLAMLAERGVGADADDSGTRWRVHPGQIAARDHAIEPDLVNAATFLAVPLITGGSVTVGWPPHTVQAAETIVGTLEALGGRVEHLPGQVTVHGTGTVLGADLDLTRASELTCIVAALLSLADRPGRIRGVGHIRHHETDRLAALENELTKLGGSVAQTADGLTITPRPLAGGTFATYADHRMAHAGALLGLRVPGITLSDVGVTTKTMADFPQRWSALVTP